MKVYEKFGKTYRSSFSSGTGRARVNNEAATLELLELEFFEKVPEKYAAADYLS